jgi:multidrug efflux pump subunit AcrB
MNFTEQHDLLGLTLRGIVIDDAIVVLENIVLHPAKRFRAEAGGD